VYKYHIFFIHSSIHRHLSWFHSLAIVNSAAINMGGQVSLLYANLHSFRYTPRSYTAGSHSSSIFRFFKEPLIYIPTNNIEGSFCPTPSLTVIVFCFLGDSILTGVIWNLTVVLIYISWRANDVEHFFIIYCPFVLPLKKTLFNSLTIYQLDCIFFCCLTFWALYIFWILTLYPLNSWKRLSPILWVVSWFW
jgi:hypothetical protein